MNNVFKYKNFTQKLLEYSVLFLACFIFLSTNSDKTTTYRNSVNTPAAKYTVRQIICYRLTINNQNIIFVSTGNSILLFDNKNWNTYPLPEKCLLTIDSHNIIYIAAETFIGTIRFNESCKPEISKTITKSGLVQWGIPEKFYILDNKLYLESNNILFRITGNKMELVDLTPIYNRWWSWILYSIIVITVILLYIFKRKTDFNKEKTKLERIIQERTAELMKEKERTDDLLANLLPKDTADELKKTGKATSQKYDLVTVLFSDIQGFTKIAEEMNPEKLIDELDNFFFQFDSVVEKYNIEKIKTIGDAYMCAGGIPYKNRTNPVEVVLAALEMQEYMRQLKQKNVEIWDLRIGIHTGAIIAGVVGHKRVSYDIWGDTVNTASRMESSGEPGKVNISGQTFELVKDFFICEYRGKMPVKYKGDVDMYFVKGIRPEFSIDLKLIPNKKFFIQLQLLRINDIEEFMDNKLVKELPGTLYFHNAKRTKEIYTLVELIGRAEGLSQEEMLLIRTASMFVYSGFINTYPDFISSSIRLAKDILIKFKYSEDQIETISKLIQSSRAHDNINNRLQAILIDAIYNYLGRADYLSLIINLFNEMKLMVCVINEKEWFISQLRFLEKFTFSTQTAKLLREIPVNDQIRKIKEYAKLD